MDYITILEYIGVFAFAVSGAIVAIEEEFDIEKGFWKGRAAILNQIQW